MDKKQQRRLKAMLAELDTGERNRLIKRAGKMRKAATRGRSADGRRRSLDEFLFELLEPDGDGGERQRSPRSRAPGPADDGLERGTVVGLSAGMCRVRLEGNGQAGPTDPSPEIVTAVLPGDLARRQQSEVAVGDHVLLKHRDEDRRVATVLPRTSLLTRADPHARGRRRAIAANVDIVAVVVAAKAPPLHPRLIDRYLVAVEHAGARPVLVVNKIDLLDDHNRHETLAKLQPYRSLGLPVLPCSASTGDGLDELRAELEERVCVFVGQSGVGKSSLLNALGGRAAAATGAVRAGDGRGRHTTTASALYELPGGIGVIDTPGIRRFSLEDDDAESLAAGFAEFTPYAGRCKYRDCTHSHEPGCAVRRAVADGAIPRSRYVSYRKLLAGDGDDPAPADEDPAAPCAAGQPAAGSFTCVQCGRVIPLDAAGSSHRNHCPQCLHSVHLDDHPGDRSACCGGVMEPVSVWVRRTGEWAIVHRCRECGRLSSNRIAGDDNELLLMSLAVRPLSSPPFPLERLAGRASSIEGGDGRPAGELDA